MQVSLKEGLFDNANVIFRLGAPLCPFLSVPRLGGLFCSAEGLICLRRLTFVSLQDAVCGRSVHSHEDSKLQVWILEVVAELLHERANPLEEAEARDSCSQEQSQARRKWGAERLKRPALAENTRA